MGWKREFLRHTFLGSEAEEGRDVDGMKQKGGDWIDGESNQNGSKQTGLSCCCEGSYALMRVRCDDDDEDTIAMNLAKRRPPSVSSFLPPYKITNNIIPALPTSSVASGLLITDAICCNSSDCFIFFSSKQFFFLGFIFLLCRLWMEVDISHTLFIVIHQ